MHKKWILRIAEHRYMCHIQVIYTTIRFITLEEIDKYLDDCIALKKEFPHLIAGSPQLSSHHWVSN